MEFIMVGIITLIGIIVLKFVFDYNIKALKQLGEDEELDNLAKAYPGNLEMCKDYLKKLGNEKVKIEENEGAEASLYIAITDKILIANIQKSYTRIQTIAHECLHSIQSRKLLLFNFFFSNIYFVYFVAICVFMILKMLPYKMMFLIIFMILSMIYYMVRIFLENDAMIKARYLAKEYMEEKKISSEEEINKLVQGFDKINTIGIKCINYHFFMQIMIKLLVLLILGFTF
ncbi:MAG: hypothetical protein HFJ35_00370 [Clostridia bacterium]|nr:hypothetical protein [Clostridia bacterium]